MSTAQTEVKDYLGMSDEDFLNASAPATGGADAGEDQQETAGSANAEGSSADIEETTTTSVTGAAAEPDKKDEGNDAGEDPGTPGSTGNGAEPSAAEAAASDKPADAGAVTEPAADGKPKEGDKPAEKPAGEQTGNDADKSTDKAEGEAEPAKVVDYEGFFKQVMAPFKANGKEFKLQTPEEAIRLMQMGAGYGRKLQDLQPALKTLRMLEKADLLDEGKLSFLIDINNKNPEAIKKLIADSGIDPLDLNIGDNVTYTPKNHAVSDKEMAFQTVLNDVESMEGGPETLRVVNQTWDQQSKSALWESPEILGVIQSQRENGIYDQIVAEIQHQKVLGTIPHNAPFLHAYKLAGDKLFPPSQNQSQPGNTPPQPQVIATRTAAPKAQVQNGTKAAAAASTKTTTSRSAATKVNPLEMADDVFLRQFEGRF